MEKLNDQGCKNQKWRGYGFGILMVLVGLVLLGLNSGMLDLRLREVIFFWPSILILIGLVHLTKKHKLGWGLMWVFTGTFFMIAKVIQMYPSAFPNSSAENFTGTYWPILVILFGVILILNKVFFPIETWKHNLESKINEHHNHKWNHKWAHKAGAFEKNVIFGGGEQIILDPVFNGGQINSVFGGLTLDLRRTTLPEGETVLEMNAVFGAITLYIPDGWRVESRLDVVFGGFEDRRLINASGDPTKKLILVGASVFGGVEILS